MKPTRSPFARWFAPETLSQSLGIGLALTIASRFAGLFRGVLFARILDRAELGVWAITNNTMQMLSVVLVFGIPAGLCRYAARYERAGQLRSFLMRTLGISFGFCALACGLGLLWSGRITRVVFEDTQHGSMAIPLCLGTFALMALNLFQGVLQGLRVYRINAMMLVVQSLGFALIGAILLTQWQPTALAGAWSFVFVSTVVTVIPCAMLWKHVQSESEVAPQDVERGMWRSLFMYSIGTWGASAVYSLWGWLDRYMLLHFDTLGTTACLEQLGTYHIVENVTGPLLALGAGWSTQVLAHTVHLWESNQKDAGRSLVQFSTKITTLVMTCVAVALVQIKRWLLAGVFGDSSMASGEILELVLVTTCLLSAQCMVRSYVLCRERVWAASFVWVCAVTVSVLLNSLLVPALHLKGAAITTVVTSLGSTWLLMWLTKRSGLAPELGTWLVTIVPFILLLPSWAMLTGLACVGWIVVRTDWLLTAAERDRVNVALDGIASRVLVRWRHAA
jgi:O-antigen/teichoic acid export membrane protein